MSADRHRHAAENVAEGILEDLFTRVLDWRQGNLDFQVGHADMMLTKNFVKYLVLEVKRPGASAWNRRAVDAAIEQARRYADEQNVTSIALSDGAMLYAGNVEIAG